MSDCDTLITRGPLTGIPQEFNLRLPSWVLHSHHLYVDLDNIDSNTALSWVKRGTTLVFNRIASKSSETLLKWYFLPPFTAFFHLFIVLKCI